MGYILTERGTQAVGRTVEGMAALKEKVGAIAARIGQLSEQTSRTGNISVLGARFGQSDQPSAVCGYSTF